MMEQAAISTSTDQPARRWKIGLIFLAGAVLLLMTLGFTMRHSGLKTRLMIALDPGYRQRLARPTVSSTFPADGEQHVGLNPTCLLNLEIPDRELNLATVNPKTIWLIETAHQRPVDVSIKSADDGQRIEITPTQPLQPGTQYSLTVTAGVSDIFQRLLDPMAIAFTTKTPTDPSIAFEKVALAHATGAGFTCVQVGPDHRLWASSDDGRIFRFDILADGQLSTPTIFDALVRAEKGPRIITGFCFDPSSSAENPILWVSHSYGTFHDPPDFSGMISRMSGAGLKDVREVVIHLPRSVKDHMNNQPVFGPDGALYWSQPSNSSYGDADPIWGMRQEHLLNATVLRLDVAKCPKDHPIDAKTPDAGGSYNPYAPDAPLTIYATGVRLSFNLLWHSNGHLYAPVNGSSAGGNTPASPDQPGLKLKDICVDEDDWLFDIVRGKYYGHPNVTQHHYVLNGGNPTSGFDFAEMPLYPVGTRPDPDWTPAVYDFGRHVSADGSLEYHDVSFGGKLDKWILVCRYNFGSDIIALHPDSTGGIDRDNVAIAGLRDFQTPLDLTEDNSNGNLYVTEYGQQRIVLLRPSPLHR